MPRPGYCRFPTIHGDTVVFTCEDDLWTVPARGGQARRLTSSRGAAAWPALSPDGRWLAFACSDDGPAEVAVMPAAGGEPRRLTWLGAGCRVVGWTPAGVIVFATAAHQPFRHLLHLYTVAPDGRTPPTLLPCGPAVHASFGPKRGLVIGRHYLDSARWKRYRGGQAGDLWIDVKGTGDFRRLIALPGNLTGPTWVGERIYFVSDHEGHGDLYSCDLDGSDLQRHTRQRGFYVRHPATDGCTVVYHAGADLFRFDPQTDRAVPVPVTMASTRPQTAPKFVEAARYLHDAELHPDGHLLALECRGRLFVAGNWEGPVRTLPGADGVRQRLPRWLDGGRRLLAVSDQDGEDRLELHDLSAPVPVRERLNELGLGRPLDLVVAPAGRVPTVAVCNHRSELWVAELGRTAKARRIDRSRFGPLAGVDWSPDGRWLAYGIPVSRHTSIIRLAEVATGKTHDVTRPVLVDLRPRFDPAGKYLYFLSHREFDPVYDNLHFDLGFPRGVRPYLAVLAADAPSPFVPVPRPFEPPKDAKEAREGRDGDGNRGGKGPAVAARGRARALPAARGRAGSKAVSPPAEDAKPGAAPVPAPIRIDVDGLPDRILAFPVPEGRYVDLLALAGKVLLVAQPIEGALNRTWLATEPAAKAAVSTFDFETQKLEPLLGNVTGVALAAGRKAMLARVGNRLRVLKAGEKPDEKAGDTPSRKSGWVDLTRFRVLVKPEAEWRQMFGETWRLQRDHFWHERMPGIEWRKVHDRYQPLLARVASRSELSDLLWELQGELGASHAYELGGDYRPGPHWGVGLLGADLVWDGRLGRWKIARLPAGDPWLEAASSPLTRPGVGVREGETLLAVDGVPLSAEVPPGAALLNRAGAEVVLTIGDARGRAPRLVTVKTLATEQPLRYRAWVEANRRTVHAATGGRIGYVHVPDMGALGYAEFHRAFLAESDREGLIVDVRFNGGGHVSPLLLEKLARRRIARVESRWFGVDPYPGDSVGGPIVAITNEYAGSDGDIFSHCFKLMNLGPLVGKRTWGGVIGIWPRNVLVDGSIVTQPEFSFWFEDVGFRVENYGTDPTIEVEMPPAAYRRGEDPQLARALLEINGLLAKSGSRQVPSAPGKRPPSGGSTQPRSGRSGQRQGGRAGR